MLSIHVLPNHPYPGTRLKSFLLGIWNGKAIEDLIFSLINLHPISILNISIFNEQNPVLVNPHYLTLNHNHKGYHDILTLINRFILLLRWFIFHSNQMVEQKQILRHCLLYDPFKQEPLFMCHEVISFISS